MKPMPQDFELSAGMERSPTAAFPAGTQSTTQSGDFSRTSSDVVVPCWIVVSGRLVVAPCVETVSQSRAYEEAVACEKADPLNALSLFVVVRLAFLCSHVSAACLPLSLPVCVAAAMPLTVCCAVRAPQAMQEGFAPAFVRIAQYQLFGYAGARNEQAPEFLIAVLKARTPSTWTVQAAYV
jgi:hypothetical protein